MLVDSNNFIAITQRLFGADSYNEEREALSTDWGRFFRKYLSEYRMLPLSVACDVDDYLPFVSGVILSGGNDLSLFNESVYSKKRDNFECAIIEACMRDSIPLFGVCRGAQMIAHYFSSRLQSCVNHIGTHEVEQKGVRFLVNSYHNFGISKLSDDLIMLAKSNDGMIEAFQHKEYSIFGIMWHIERNEGMENTAIFNEFLSSCMKRAQSKITHSQAKSKA